MQVLFTRQWKAEALEIHVEVDHQISIVGPVELGSRKMRIGSIVMRCFEFEKMLAFWQQALHYTPREPAKRGWVVLRDPEGKGPNLSLDQVPEKRSGKRSRLHLDLYTNNREGEVERLIKFGATRYPWRYKPHDDFVVLEDPDGNLFCVVQVHT
jgi:catechol 2,3-dioxygenase-like lactoylglutathione lyase family enzyme